MGSNNCLIPYHLRKDIESEIMYYIDMRFYISDLHFYHEALLDHLDHRPFKSVEEMNEYMVERWNSKVKRSDEVFVLGDISQGNVENSIKILNRLNGKLSLMIGNHDSFAQKSKFLTTSTRFRKISHYTEISDNNRKVILSHYPIMFYNGQFSQNSNGEYNTYMLYGHVHNSFDELLINKFIAEAEAYKREIKGGIFVPTPFQMINVFCMFSDYQPLTLDEWIALDRERRKKIRENLDALLSTPHTL